MCDIVEFKQFSIHEKSHPLTDGNATICVWLMVCDEEQHIESTLRSAATLESCFFVVADTGSKDKTVDKAITVCQSLQKPFYILQISQPMYEKPFPSNIFNFAAYRNRILRFIKRVAKERNEEYWMLSVDASDIIKGGECLQDAIGRLNSYKQVGAGMVKLVWNDESHAFQRLLRTNENTTIYKEARHNYVDTSNTTVVDLRECGFFLFQDRIAAKDSALKYKKDIEYFQWRLREEPTDGRSNFYLAESFYNDNQLQKAYEQYFKCTNLPIIVAEERYRCHFRCAQILQMQEGSKDDKNIILMHYKKAFETIPTSLAAMEIYKHLKVGEKKDDVEEAYKWIKNACSTTEQCHLHENDKDNDVTRWEMLAEAAKEEKDRETEAKALLKAEEGRVKWQHKN